MNKAATAEHTEAPASAAVMIPIDQIVPSRTNPRKIFDKSYLEELSESIARKGVLQPLLLRRAGEGYEVVAGECRFRAAKAAGLDSIPATIRDLDEEAVIEIQVIENLQRRDLHPLEEAAGYKALMGFGRDAARIAHQVGKSEKYVYDRIKLLELIPEGQTVFLAGEITPGHAILISRLAPAQQKMVLGEPDSRTSPLWQHDDVLFRPDAKTPKFGYRKAKSVRELEGWIDKNVRFKTDQVEQILFPETARAIEEATEAKQKIVLITHQHATSPEVREPGGQRIYSVVSWKNATGEGLESEQDRYGTKRRKSQTCEKSVLGVFGAGPARGETLRVCVNRSCGIHWPERKKPKPASRTSSQSQAKRQAAYEEERRREEAVRERFKKARPAILQAFQERISEMDAKPGGPAAQLVARHVWENKIPKLKSLEDLVRAGAYHLIGQVAEWVAQDDFPELGKDFGVDVQKILDEHAPVVEQPKSEDAPAKRAKRAAAPEKKARKKK